jgi:hypothetical protein
MVACGVRYCWILRDLIGVFRYELAAGVDKNGRFRRRYLLYAFAFSTIEINELCFLF